MICKNSILIMVGILFAQACKQNESKNAFSGQGSNTKAQDDVIEDPTMVGGAKAVCKRDQGMSVPPGSNAVLWCGIFSTDSSATMKKVNLSPEIQSRSWIEVKNMEGELISVGQTHQESSSPDWHWSIEVPASYISQKIRVRILNNPPDVNGAAEPTQNLSNEIEIKL